MTAENSIVYLMTKNRIDRVEKWACKSQWRLWQPLSSSVQWYKLLPRTATSVIIFICCLLMMRRKEDSPGPKINKNNAGIMPKIFLSTEICNIGYSLLSIRTVTAIMSNATIPNSKITTARNRFDCIKIFPDLDKKQTLIRYSEYAVRKNQITDPNTL